MLKRLIAVLILLSASVPALAFTCNPPSSVCFSPPNVPVCKNLNTDVDNCGACGNICPGSDTCVTGVCENPSTLTCEFWDAGVLVENFPSVQTVDGTVTCNQGDAGWTVDVPIWDAGVIIENFPETQQVSGLVNAANAISQNSLFLAVSATSTQTTLAETLAGEFENAQLQITWGSVTGSPSGCTIQLETSLDGANYTANGTAIPVTPGTSLLTPLINLSMPLGYYAEFVYACGTYPSAGTLTMKVQMSSAEPMVDRTVATLGTAATAAVQVIIAGANDGGFLPVIFPAAQAVTESGTWNVGVTSPDGGYLQVVFPAAQLVAQSGVWNVGITGQNDGGYVSVIFPAAQNVTDNLTEVASSAVVTAKTGVLQVGVIGGDGGFVQVTFPAAQAVTQSAGPWTENLTQINSQTIATQANGVQQVAVIGGDGGYVQVVFPAAQAVTESGVWNVGITGQNDGGYVSVIFPAAQAVTESGVWNVGITGQNDGGYVSVIFPAAQAVTQSNGPWTENQTQINGNAVVTTASGVQQVGVIGGDGGYVQVTFPAAQAVTESGAWNVGVTGWNDGGYLIVEFPAAQAVTQSAGPWTENETQINGNAVVTTSNGVQQVGVIGGDGGYVQVIFPAAQAVTESGVWNVGITGQNDGGYVGVNVENSLTTTPSTLTSTPFSAQSGTATHTSSVDTLSGIYSTVQLEITSVAGTGGSGCTIQLQSSVDDSNFTNNGTAVAFTYGTAVQSTVINMGLALAGYAQYVYACGSYPTGSPTVTVKAYYSIANQNADRTVGAAGTANANVQTVQGNASGVPMPVVLSSGPGSDGGWSVSVANTITVTATDLSTNIAQVNGSTVATAETGVMQVGVIGGDGGYVQVIFPTAQAVTESGIWNVGITGQNDGGYISVVFPAAQAVTESGTWNVGNTPQVLDTTPFSSQAITGTETSSADTLTPGSYTSVMLQITFPASGGGTPSGCQIQPESSIDNSNFTANGTAIPITIGTALLTGVESFNFGLGRYVKYVYSCSSYPTGSPTLTMTASYSANVQLIDTAVGSPLAAAEPPNFVAVGLNNLAQGSNIANQQLGWAGPLSGDRQGRLLVNTTHPNFWNCNVSAASVQTECQSGASGYSLYITDVTMSVSTATTMELLQGTGTYCDGGTTNVVAGLYYFPANGGMDKSYSSPIKLLAGNNLCCVPGAASGSCTIEGFTAP
jgi:hypothetical protein